LEAETNARFNAVTGTIMFYFVVALPLKLLYLRVTKRNNECGLLKE
jgi:hypothetical protein